jgi:hypothetical protein
VGRGDHALTLLGDECLPLAHPGVDDELAGLAQQTPPIQLG